MGLRNEEAMESTSAPEITQSPFPKLHVHVHPKGPYVTPLYDIPRLIQWLEVLRAGEASLDRRAGGRPLTGGVSIRVTLIRIH